MRLHRLLGGRRLSWIRRRCHRQLRRPEFPRADHRSVGGVTPPLGLLAARHAAQARGEAGVIELSWLIPATKVILVKTFTRRARMPAAPTTGRRQVEPLRGGGRN